MLPPEPSLIDRARAGTLPDCLAARELATLAAFDTDPETLPDDVRWEREKFGHLGRDPVREGWERRIEYACHSRALAFSQAVPEAPFFIERAAFRAWLSDRGIEPGEHIRAWLRPLEQAEAAHQEDAAPKRETQAGRVEGALKECERRAAKHGAPFDRSNMPGTKAEFLDLLHALDVELRSIKTVDSLDRYLSKAGCKWPLDASAQPSAAPLYARLFPEARIRPPGAVSPQRRKA